jgi:hypothetical protein
MYEVFCPLGVLQFLIMIYNLPILLLVLTQIFLWCGCVHLVMQRPGVILLNTLNNKMPIIKKLDVVTTFMDIFHLL